VGIVVVSGTVLVFVRIYGTCFGIWSGVNVDGLRIHGSGLRTVDHRHSSDFAEDQIDDSPAKYCRYQSCCLRFLSWCHRYRNRYLNHYHSLPYLCCLSDRFRGWPWQRRTLPRARELLRQQQRILLSVEHSLARAGGGGRIFL